MDRKIILHKGNYTISSLADETYMACQEDTVKESTVIVPSESPSDILENFILLDVNDNNQILDFTNQYGPIIDIGGSSFKRKAVELGKAVTEDDDKSYPFKGKCAFPVNQFKYFQQLILNIWELKGNIDQFETNASILQNFLKLLFQPYAYTKNNINESNFLGLDCNGALGIFTYCYYKTMSYYMSYLPNYENIASFVDIFNCIKNGQYSTNNKKGYIEVSFMILCDEKPIQFHFRLPIIFEQYTTMGEYDRLWNVLRKLKDTGIYRYITGNPEDLQKNVNLHSLDISLYREVWSLGKELIRDIVNSYTSHQCLAFDENLNFVSESNASYLIQIIFDDLAIACRNSELRKCKFRKCNKYFLAKKGKKKMYCSKPCADKEKKYQNRRKR